MSRSLACFLVIVAFVSCVWPLLVVDVLQEDLAPRASVCCCSSFVAFFALASHCVSRVDRAGFGQDAGD